MLINFLRSYINTQILKCGRAGLEIGESGNRTICGVSSMERVAAYEAVDIGSTPILRAKNLYLIFIKKFVIIYI